MYILGLAAALLPVLSAMRPELTPEQVTVVEQGELPALPTEAIRAGVLGGTCSYTQAVDASGVVESVMVFDCEKVLHAAVRSYAQAFTFKSHREHGEPAPFAVTDRVSFAPVGPDALERLEAWEEPVVYPRVDWSQVGELSQSRVRPMPTGEGGVCELEVLLSAESEIVDLRPYDCADELLAPTVEAVSQWTFTPRSRRSELGPHSFVLKVKVLEDLLATHDCVLDPDAEKVDPGELQPKQLVYPRYPEAARKANLEGTCIMHILIDENGAVIAAEAFVCPVFDAAAREAALKSWYYPVKRDGTAVKVTAFATYEFKLY